MDRQDFEKIISTLEERIKYCKSYFETVKTTDDIRQLTIGQAADLKRFCTAEYEVMTTIAMVDLYHLIGMGDFTPPQMLKFTYKIREYLAFRPSIKAIAQHLDSISSLPTIPVTTKFKLLALGDLTLKSGDGPEDVSDISEYTRLQQNPASIGTQVHRDTLCFTLDDKRITIPKDRVVDFVDLLRQLFRTSFSTNNLMQKVRSRLEYSGIKWNEETPEALHGVFTSHTAFSKIKSYYDAHL